MDKKNEETVAKLYALRAGMSVISKEEDAFLADFAKVRKEKEAEYKAKLGVRAQEETARAAAEKRLGVKVDRVWKLQEKYNKTMEEYEKAKFLAEAEKAKPSFLGLFFLALCGFALAAFLILGLIVVDKGWVHNNGFYELLYGFWKDTTWVGIVCILAIAVGVIGGGVSVWFGIAFLRDFIDYRSVENKARKDVVSLAARARQEKAAIEEAKKQMQSGGLPSVSTVVAPDYDALKQDCGKRNKHVKAGAALYNALVKQYSPTLDPRDWGNIDYLIYAFETGRARDLTDALQLCDREMQTQRIENAVSNATAEISATIKRGLGSLQAQVETCFYNLSKQIDSSTSRLTDALAETNARIAETNAKIGEATRAAEKANARLAGMEGYLVKMTETAAMNKALLEKANESSSELAEDVHRLRLYADKRA